MTDTLMDTVPAFLLSYCSDLSNTAEDNLRYSVMRILREYWPVFPAYEVVCIRIRMDTPSDKSAVWDVPIASPPPGSVIDPVSSYIQFNERYPVKPTDPAFSFYVGSKLYVLSQSFLNKAIKHLVQKCGQDPKNYSCRSLRRGSATVISHSGVSNDLIQSHGTWRSSTYQRYIDFSLPQKFSVTRSMHYHINNML